MSEVTVSGSGINWTGPEFRSGPVRIKTGRCWPEPSRPQIMCHGTLEEALLLRNEIEVWATTHSIDISNIFNPFPYMEEFPGRTYGCRFFPASVHAVEQESYAEERASYLVEMIHQLRRENSLSPLRKMLEDTLQGNPPTHYKPREVELFCQMMTER